MGKKSKGARKPRGGRHEDDLKEDESVMDMYEEAPGHQDETSSDSNGVERVGRNDVQIDLFLDSLERLENKKTSRLGRSKALSQLIGCLQSGVDLCDRVKSNMESLTSIMQHTLTHRTEEEAMLAMNVISILSLVAADDGRQRDFENLFYTHLGNLATKSEELKVRICAVRTLAFVHSVCCGDVPCFRLIGDIALHQSDGIDAPPSLQMVALEAWCLLATSVVEPANVFAVSREEGVFVELVGMLANTETMVQAGQCLALLWELADETKPDVPPSESASLLCDEEEEVEKVLEMFKHVGKESSKKAGKRGHTERKSAMRSVTDWILDGVPPGGDSAFLQGGVVCQSSFGDIRLVDGVRGVLKGGMQSCLRIYPATRAYLDVEYDPFDQHTDPDFVQDAAAGGGLRCEAVDKRYMRSKMGKEKKTHRRNQRADKEQMQADCFF